MALTQFPIETDKPVIEVTLPVGKHTLELVVVDSAGLRSEPDRVTITVKAEVPVITGINPKSGEVGATVKAEITGDNLLHASEVSFSGTGITAVIGEGGTATRLPVRLEIAGQAEEGSRTFSVKTPGGTGESPAGVVFAVLGAVKPEITGISPHSGTPGSKVEVKIRGRDLSDATRVEFEGRGIEAKIVPGGSATEVPVRLGIDALAPTGPRGFAVTTPAGTARSPAGVLFTVTRGSIRNGITFDPREFPGRTVDEVPGIGPTLSKRLEESGVTNLAEMASMEPGRLAEILNVSEVRAASFIDEARRKLRE